jgi:hypothetical protein
MLLFINLNRGGLTMLKEVIGCAAFFLSLLVTLILAFIY